MFVLYEVDMIFCLYMKNNIYHYKYYVVTQNMKKDNGSDECYQYDV